MIADRQVGRFMMLSLACLVGAAALTGCAASKYRAELDRATRSGEDVERFLTVIDVDATLLDWSYREAYVRDFARSSGLDEAQTEEMLDVQRRDNERYVEFLLGVYCGDEDWEELTGASPTWRLYLEQGGQRFDLPAHVETEELDPALRDVYMPHLTIWQTLYRVRFDRQELRERGYDETRAPQLALLSPLGSLRLAW